ncbi:MAG: CRISPR system precrRNA processing endoribonuclease RAMP protein Cas6 [Candidatus Eremiobacterota bacterium]
MEIEFNRIYLSSFKISYEIKEKTIINKYEFVQLFRGAFGMRLGQMSCQNFNEKYCDTCGEDCPYREIFANPCKINPYSISPADYGSDNITVFSGSTMSFYFTLYGDKVKYLLYCLIAFERINKLCDIPVRLKKVSAIDIKYGKEEIIYETTNRMAINKSFPFSLSDAVEISKNLSSNTVRIKFLTPLFLTSGKKMMTPENFSAEILLKRIIERLKNISYYYCDVKFSKRYDFNVKVKDGELYTTTCPGRKSLSGQIQYFGGLMGEVQLEEVPDEIMPVIVFAEYMGVGKDTAFGMGKMKVDTGY